MTPPVRRSPGPAPVEIPDALVGLLDASYRSGQPLYVDVENINAPDVKELMRYARIYARRTGKSLRTYSAPLPPPAPGSHARLQMIIRDKQIYTRKAPCD